MEPSIPSITLIRHGPPSVSLRQRIRGHQFRTFVARYDAAKIDQQASPPPFAQRAMAKADYVFASHRPRATHTAELLDYPTQPVVDSEFREVEFPVDFPRHFRFSAMTWTIIALFLWRLGYSATGESYRRAKIRAQLAADRLEQQSRAGRVVLVAHGGINRLIAKELRRRGWRGPSFPSSCHWGCTTYCR